MEISAILEQASYLAHGYCLLWQPWLVALHAVPDLFIFLAYTSIPLTLTRLLSARPELQEFKGLIGLFSAFILLCGVSHLVGLLTLWYPIYPLHGVVKATTAIVSVVTAVSLVPLLPKLAALPAPGQIRSLNMQLRAEVASHEETLEHLTEIQKTLEARVDSRTVELQESNERLRVLARETVHRSNNLLAQIQSLARQCSAETEGGESWLEAFDERVATLARGNEAVLKNPRSLTANIASIVRNEYLLMPPEMRDRITVAGPDFQVRHEAAQQFALLVWELIHLSAGEGALSRADGSVRLAWKVLDDTFIIEWTETVGGNWIGDLSPTSLPARLLFQSVPHGLGGTGISLPAPDQGYRLEVPTEGLQPQDRAAATELILDAYPRTPSRLAKPAQSE